MKKMKKTLLVGLSLLAIVGLAAGMTVAFLTDTKSAVNLLEMNTLSIKQLEKERVEQSDKNVAPTNLRNFTQAKPLIPAVYEGQYPAWATDEKGNQVYQQWPTGGTNSMFTDKVQNIQDKIVFVENDGEVSAYVRTWFAFEAGSLSHAEVCEALILNVGIPEAWDNWNSNQNGVWGEMQVIDGRNYVVVCSTYIRNGGVLPAGETTRPSLVQVGLAKEVTNEQIRAIDQNNNGTLDILIYSQAIQSEGFSAPHTALSTEFGDDHPWQDGVAIPVVVQTAEELKNALAAGNSVTLKDNITIEETLTVTGNVLIDLNGKTLSSTVTGSKTQAVRVEGNAVLTLKNGTVSAPSTHVLGIFDNGELCAEDVTFTGKYGFGMNGNETSEHSLAEFENCTFTITSGYTAAYISASGNYSFKNCVLEGGSGILVRSGNVTVENCKIIANGYYGKDKAQSDIFLNTTENVDGILRMDGVSYWKKSNEEGSTGDGIVIVDRSGDGYELKGVSVVNCKFIFTSKVDELPTGYAVRYFDKNASSLPMVTPVLQGNVSEDGSAIITDSNRGGTYSFYTVN